MRWKYSIYYSIYYTYQYEYFHKYKHQEGMDDKLFQMKEELHQLAVRLLCTNNSQAQVLSFQQKQWYLTMKLNRGNNKIEWTWN